MDWTFALFLLTICIPHYITAAENDEMVVVSETSGINTCVKRENEGETIIGWEMAADDQNNLSKLGNTEAKWSMWPKNNLAENSSFAEPSDGWKIENSSDLAAGPITDYRWYALPEMKVGSDNRALIYDIKTARGNAFEEHFSILARNPELTLTLATENGTTCRWKFGMKKSRTATTKDRANGIPDKQKEDKYSYNITMSCSEVNDILYRTESTISPNLQKRIHLTQGIKWSLLSVKMDGQKIVFLNDGIRIAFWDFDRSIRFKTINFTQALHRAHATIKRHSHEMLVAPMNEVATWKNRFMVKEEQKLCLSVAYFSPERSMAVKILGLKFTQKLEPTGNKWKVQRLVSEATLSPIKQYELQIKGKSDAASVQAIGKVRLCNQIEFSKITMTNSNNVKLCFDAGSNLSVLVMNVTNLEKPVFERPEFEDQLLNAIFSAKTTKDQSPGSRIFYTTGGKRFCWKGFKGDFCEEGCSSSNGEYGFNCIEKCVNCIRSQCESNAGKCTDQTKCLNDFRRPFCREKLITMTKKARVVKSSISSIDVNIQNAAASVNPGTISQAMHRVLINTQYVGNLANDLKGILKSPKASVELSMIDKNVRLVGFRSNSTYNLETQYCEGPGQNDCSLSLGEENLITTSACSASKNNALVRIGEVTKNSIELKWRYERDEPESCPPEDYFIKVNGVNFHGTYLLTDGLRPATDYNVTFAGKDGQVAGETFSVRTREGAPTEVQKLIKSEKGTGLSFEWQAPATLNGHLDYYLVHLTHVGFKACKNMSKDSSLDITEKVNKTSVTFTKLEPYAKYKLSVAAKTGELGNFSTITFNTNRSETINGAPIMSTEKGKHHLEFSWEPNCKKAGCVIQKDYRIRLLNGNVTVVENITNVRHFAHWNLVRGTLYTFEIETRCSGDWKNVGPGLLTTQVYTDQFDSNEIAGICVAALISCACLVSLLALSIWRVIKSKERREMIRRELSNNQKMRVRYELTPKRYGTSFKRRTIAEHVRHCQANGTLKAQFESIPKGQLKDWLVGMNGTNIYKNRYANMAAYDHTRVVLDGLDDYINANFIGDRGNPRAYIATQGPLQSTTADFWSMVWQEEVTTIVMLTKLWEKRERCYQYWPNLHSSATFNEILVQNRSEKIFTDHIARTFILTGRQGAREILQLQYTAWPHQGVPDDLPALATFVAKVHARKRPPLLVHCSGGTGRTGTVILTDLCLRSLVRDKKVNVWSVFKNLRHQRVNMVENEQQYELAHWILAQHPQNIIL